MFSLRHTPCQREDETRVGKKDKKPKQKGTKETEGDVVEAKEEVEKEEEADG